MESLNAKQLAGMLDAAADAIIENEKWLCELDSQVGDGDHGVTAARGFRAVKEMLAENADASIAALLEKTGDALAETMGGAIGPIFGSIFTAMGEDAGDIAEIDAAKLADMLEAGLSDVQMIGGAQPGDRTLVDALAPAVEAMQRESSLPLALEKAAGAARKGAEATKEMQAKKGRAKFLQEKSVGYQDAGATSMMLVLRAFADYATK